MRNAPGVRGGVYPLVGNTIGMRPVRLAREGGMIVWFMTIFGSFGSVLLKVGFISPFETLNPRWPSSLM